jgi:multidrug efflux pump
VTVRKTGDTNILTIAFVSTDGSMDKQDIADYVASNIQDPLSRVNGVGDITPTARNTQCASGSIRPNSTAYR